MALGKELPLYSQGTGILRVGDGLIIKPEQKVMDQSLLPIPHMPGEKPLDAIVVGRSPPEIGAKRPCNQLFPIDAVPGQQASFEFHDGIFRTHADMRIFGHFRPMHKRGRSLLSSFTTPQQKLLIRQLLSAFPENEISAKIPKVPLCGKINRKGLILSGADSGQHTASGTDFVTVRIKGPLHLHIVQGEEIVGIVHPDAHPFPGDPHRSGNLPQLVPGRLGGSVAGMVAVQGEIGPVIDVPEIAAVEIAFLPLPVRSREPMASVFPDIASADIVMSVDEIPDILKTTRTVAHSMGILQHHHGQAFRDVLPQR